MKYQSQHRRVALVRLEPYLAKYARMKFEVDPKSGGIRIPDSFNLYHCVWQAMSKWPLERWHIGVLRRSDEPDGNLLIHLPDRRENGFRKDPRYWNYISPRHARQINRELKRLFDWEFHHYVETLLEYNPGTITKKEAVGRFARKYALGIDVEEALLKNFQRHERSVRILLGLRKRKSPENNVNSARLSTTVLSCRKPPFLGAGNGASGFADGLDDGTDLSWCKGALLTMAITEGLQSLGKSGIVGNPSL